MHTMAVYVKPLSYLHNYERHYRFICLPDACNILTLGLILAHNAYVSVIMDRRPFGLPRGLFGSRQRRFALRRRTCKPRRVFCG